MNDEGQDSKTGYSFAQIDFCSKYISFALLDFCPLELLSCSRLFKPLSFSNILSSLVERNKSFHCSDQVGQIYFLKSSTI